MHVIKVFILISLLLGSVGCSVNKNSAPVPQEEVNPRPQWVTNRPISSFDFIGIGMARKDANPNDFQDIAKRNALSDLVSEISVQVSSNSLLFTVERDNTFREDFKNIIRTESNTEITDFQVAGVWENDREYWVFYRLNRQTHRQQVELRKRQASQRAFSFYQAAKEAEQTDVRLAINNYLKSLDALKEFWNDNLEFEHQGRTLFLATEAYQSLQQLCSGIQMQLNNDRIVLNVGNSFQQDLQGAVSYRGQPVDAFPVNLNYPGQHGMVRGTLNTNRTGVFSFQIARINRERNNPNVELTYRVPDLIENGLDRRIALGFLSPLSNWRKVVPILVEPPLVHIISDERNLGVTRRSESVKNFLQAELVRRNFKFTNNPGDADVTITVSGDTKPLGNSGDFHTTALDLTVRAINNANGLTLFSESLTNIRGVQLDHERAGEVAYQRAEQDLRRTTVNRIVEAIN
ncbi:MAG: LPP20 family lipoprotein [Luteibaculaceae bacterium]